jgi:hypothetical protein
MKDLDKFWPRWLGLLTPYCTTASRDAGGQTLRESSSHNRLQAVIIRASPL